MEPETDRPLAGRTVVVTRPRAQSGKLTHMLEDWGATVIEFPTIEIRPVKRLPDIGTLDRYDWILFTSRNAVRYFVEALPVLGIAPDFEGVKVGVVGPGTHAAAEALDVPVHLVAKDHVAEGLLAVLEEAEPDINGKRVLIPRGNLARDLLPDRLRALGADVSVAVFYETVMPEVSRDAVAGVIAAKPDAVVFTSGSTARNFVKLLGSDGVQSLVQWGTLFVSIGPQTTQAAEDSGITIGLTPDDHNLDALVDALAARFGGRVSNG